MKEEKKEMINIYQRMSSVMNEVRYVKKREKKQGMMYSFVSHDDVSALLHMPFVKAGIMPVTNVLSYSVDGNRHNLEIVVDFVNIDIPEEKISVKGWGFALDTQDKGYGKAMSYALKYIFLKTFVLESGDEDEIDAYQKDDPNEPKTAKLISANQVEELKSLLRDLGRLMDKKGYLEYLSTLKKILKVKELEETKASDFMTAKSSIEINISEKVREQEEDENDKSRMA